MKLRGNVPSFGGYEMKAIIKETITWYEMTSEDNEDYQIHCILIQSLSLVIPR